MESKCNCAHRLVLAQRRRLGVENKTRKLQGQALRSLTQRLILVRLDEFTHVWVEMGPEPTREGRALQAHLVGRLNDAYVLMQLAEARVRRLQEHVWECRR